MVLQDTVLVIDDDEELSLALNEALTDSGFNVEVARDGKEGLEMALEIKPNIILLDLVMPVMDGWEVLERLQTDEWGKNAYVIILTNNDDITSLSRAIEGRGYEYLVKTDWKISDVVQKIKDRIN